MSTGVIKNDIRIEKQFTGVKAIRRGDVTTLWVSNNPSSAVPANTWLTITTLDSEYCPSESFESSIANYNNISSNIAFRVLATGEVQLSANSATSNVRARGQFVYFN